MVHAIIPKLFAKHLSKQSIAYLVLVTFPPYPRRVYSWNEVVGFLFDIKGGHNQKNRKPKLEKLHNYSVQSTYTLFIWFFTYIQWHPYLHYYAMMIFAFAS